MAHGASSQAGLTQPASAGSLARTLGRHEQATQRSTASRGFAAPVTRSGSITRTSFLEHVQRANLALVGFRHLGLLRVATVWRLLGQRRSGCTSPLGAPDRHSTLFVPSALHRARVRPNPSLNPTRYGRPACPCAAPRSSCTARASRPASAVGLAQTLGRTSDTPVQALFRSGSSPSPLVVVASLKPRSKPVEESGITKVKRFFRFASTMSAHGRDQGLSTPRAHCLQGGLNQVRHSLTARLAAPAGHTCHLAPRSRVSAAGSDPSPPWPHQAQPGLRSGYSAA